jgi:hypothetical protein
MTKPGRRNRWSLLALILLLASSAAWASDPNKPARKVRVSVLVIYATEKDDKIDAKLACIAREVRKTHPKLTGFRMGKLSSKSLTVGAGDKFDLPEEQKACVMVQRAADNMDRVRLKVGPPSMGEITYSTPCGKFLPILTPFRTKTGEVVLIAVRVQPCGGK